MSADDFPWRRDVLGGSDAAALLGKDPFRTAGDVYATKKGLIPTADDPAKAIGPKEFGTALEPLLIEVAARHLGHPVAAQVHYKHPTAPLGVSVDAIDLEPPGCLIEAKTVACFGPSPYEDAYGEDGTGEVPDAVNIQVHHALGVLDAQRDVPRITRVLVVAYIGGRGFKVYPITRNDDFVRELTDYECWWWTTYIEGNRCPTDDPPSLSTLRAWPRHPRPTPVPIDRTFFAELQEATEKKKQLEAPVKHLEGMIDFIKRQIITSLGDAEEGACELGRVTYKATPRAGYTVDPTMVRTFRLHPTRRAV